MKDKSSKPAFNKASAKPEQQRPINHHELHKKLDNYEKVARTPEHKEAMKKRTDQYLKAKQTREAMDGVKMKNFKDGINAGIHTKQQLTDVIRTNEQLQANLRQATWKDAKNYYVKNFSLQKNFKEQVKEKDKGMHKGKN